MEFELAMQDPAGMFNKPIDVVNDESLSVVQKRLILQEWASDAEALLRADEENMSIDEGPTMLSRIHKAFNSLED